MTKADQQHILAEASTAITDLCRLEHVLDEAGKVVKCLHDHFRKINQITRVQDTGSAADE